MGFLDVVVDDAECGHIKVVAQGVGAKVVEILAEKVVDSGQQFEGFTEIETSTQAACGEAAGSRPGSRRRLGPSRPDGAAGSCGGAGQDGYSGGW